MSLILEALRKSEAERRRGQTPDLLSDAMPATPMVRRTTPNRGVLAAVIGAALVALLLVAWWLRSPAQPESAQVPAEASVAVEESPAPPVRIETPQSSAPLSPPSPPVPVAPASTASIPGPSEAEAPPPAASASPAIAARVEAPQPRIIEPQTAQPVPVATSEPAAPAPAFTSPDVPLKLSDLSTEERQQLPTLKVSMHMWAPDSSGRFAIIDGTRVNEGDRVGEATIEAIQQDSVMLSWRGRRIRLPIR